MIAAHLNLPQQLDGGLVLRWATPDDIDQVATFNSLVHGSGTDRPALEVATWTRDLMDGRHPHVRAHDFTVVVDPARQVEGRDKIVSSLLLLSQTWSYDGIEFGVGQPEIVGTDPDYRRRGLVRMQMDVVHSLSAARGELAQVITGIPWYYRQFGYEMTVNLSGSRAPLGTPGQRDNQAGPAVDGPSRDRGRSAAHADIGRRGNGRRLSQAGT